MICLILNCVSATQPKTFCRLRLWRQCGRAIKGCSRQWAYLKDGDKWLPERVEVASWLVLVDDEVELAAEQLHAEQREYNDEEEQQQEETGDWTHTVE